MLLNFRIIGFGVMLPLQYWWQLLIGSDQFEESTDATVFDKLMINFSDISPDLRLARRKSPSPPARNVLGRMTHPQAHAAEIVMTLLKRPRQSSCQYGRGLMHYVYFSVIFCSPLKTRKLAHKSLENHYIFTNSLIWSIL